MSDTEKTTEQLVPEMCLSVDGHIIELLTKWLVNRPPEDLRPVSPAMQALVAMATSKGQELDRRWSAAAGAAAPGESVAGMFDRARELAWEALRASRGGRLDRKTPPPAVQAWRTVQ